MIDKKSGELIWVAPKTLPNLSNCEMISIDLETKDEGLMNGVGPGGVRGAGYILGVAVAVKDASWYFSLNHPESDNWDISKFRKWFNSTMGNVRQPKVGANILYDLEWLYSQQMYVEGKCLDVQVAEPLIDENQMRYSLEVLAQKYLPEDMWKQSDLILQVVKDRLGPKIKKAQEHLWKLPASDVGVYAEYDAISTLAVLEKQMPILEAEGLMQVFDVETRLIPMLLEMRFAGVLIDESKVGATRDALQQQLIEERKNLKNLAGVDINVNLADEIGKAFDRAGITYPRTPKTDKPSFTKPWLLNHESPLAKQINIVRSAEKVIGTFIDGHILGNLHKGRIHCSFHQLRSDDSGTVSGRFSSSNPNLQQMPSRHPVYSKLIRGLFIPEEDCAWWKYDASQIEYRLIVHYAVMSNLPKASEAAQQYIDDPTTDFHQLVADMIGIDRKPAKDTNFGLAYNMGKEKLGRSLGLDEQTAEKFFNEYHERVPFMKLLARSVNRVANQRGYIRTILNRRRRFDKWEPPMNYGQNRVPALPREEAIEAYGNHIQRAFTYKSMNALIQGSAADDMKKGMVDLYEDGVFDVIGIPSLTVHDELDGSCPKTKEAAEGLLHAKKVLESCLILKVPTIWDLETGPNWYEVKEFTGVFE